MNFEALEMGFETLEMNFGTLETGFEAGHGRPGLRRSSPPDPRWVSPATVFISNLVWLFSLLFFIFFLN